MTIDFAAAIDTNDLLMSYHVEDAWGVMPAPTTSKYIRLDAEGFTSNKSRTRPNEISATGQASAAITTKEESPGSLNFSVSAGTHNDLVAASIGSSFAAAHVPIVGVTLAAVSDGFTDSGNGLAAALVGQFLRASGFPTVTNNIYYKILSVAAGKITTSPAPAAAETGDSDSTLTFSSMVRNGTDFTSFHFQKQLAAALFLEYAGAWPTGGTLDVGIGDYLKGTLAFLNKSEVSATSSVMGTIAAAPTGTVIDSVNGISNVRRNNTAVVAFIQKIGMKWNKEGARAQYAMGSAAAVGMGKGKFTAGGSLSSYFKDFALFAEFKNETGGPISFQALDNAGKGYIVSWCNATIMNPKIVAGQASADFVAEFEIEGNPDVSSPSIYGGKTIQIDYFA
jgi:hypothetical protein